MEMFSLYCKWIEQMWVPIFPSDYHVYVNFFRYSWVIVTFQRNYILVKGEIRKLRVDQMEWTSKKSNRDKNDEQYYLIAEVR